MDSPIKYLLLLCLPVLSCTAHEQLNKVLSFSGNNKLELLKVLEHYSKDSSDSLKYKAALYLIANMSYHYSLYNENQRYCFKKCV